MCGAASHGCSVETLLDAFAVCARYVSAVNTYLPGTSDESILKKGNQRISALSACSTLSALHPPLFSPRHAEAPSISQNSFILLVFSASWRLCGKSFSLAGTSDIESLLHRDAVTQRVARQLRRGTKAQLLHDAVLVKLRRPNRDLQNVRDLLHGLSFGD